MPLRLGSFFQIIPANFESLKLSKNMSIRIFHNPRCQKSRETLQLIQEKGVEADIFLYLEEKLSKKLLKDALKALGISAEKLIRKSEPAFKENFKGKALSEDEWIEAMLQYPKLIERPIVIKDGKAVLGRPPENVIDLIG